MTNHPSPLDRAPSLADVLAQRLQQEIEQGHFAPGEKLPSEQQLALSYGVSRPIVREAIGRLKHDGLVTSRQGSGAFVAESGGASVFRLDIANFEDRHEIESLIELLMAIESAATGMAALMLVVPELFRAMLLAGTAYLLWIGWGIWRSADAAPSSLTSVAPPSSAAIYRRAVTTCLLNPKAYAFTLALFPAFVRSDTRSLVMQTLAMGLITVGTQIAVYGAVAAVAVRARALIHHCQRTIARSMGALLMVSALLTAMRAWAG